MEEIKTNIDHTILIIDDDKELCELLNEYLTSENFIIQCKHSGDDGLMQIRTHANDYDLIVLDVMLPGKNGFEVLRELRSFSQIPVLMLTAKGEDIDRIIGLEMGADDYMPKPGNPRELVARIRAILRRSDNSSSSETEKIIIGNVELEPTARRASVDGEEIELTSSEYNVLATLMKNVGAVISKAELTEQALHKKLEAYDRSIDMHVSNLRSKLKTKNKPSPIKTVRGIGYMYVTH